MKSNSSVQPQQSILPVGTFLVFLLLKLQGTLDWSWWWVTSPLWGPVALLLGLAIGCFVAAGFAALIGSKKR